MHPESCAMEAVRVEIHKPGSYKCSPCVDHLCGTFHRNIRFDCGYSIRGDPQIHAVPQPEARIPNLTISNQQIVLAGLPPASAGRSRHHLDKRSSIHVKPANILRLQAARSEMRLPQPLHARKDRWIAYLKRATDSRLPP